MRLLRLMLVGALALLGSGLVLAGAVSAAERTIIILDGSGSMWAQIEGEARISIARDTLGEVLDAVPGDLELGLMSYGHREEGNCEDIELMVAPAAGTADDIRAAAAGITPRGKTPISEAVRRAAEDLAYLEEKATVILITDGIESCEADPCQLASELEQQGVDFTTHVVGFGLSDEEGRQVACLAENTGGTYFEAGDGDALAEALTATVTQVAEAAEPAPAPEPAAPEFNFDPELVLVEGGAHLRGDAVSPAWVVSRAAADGSKGDHVSTDYGVEWKTNLEPGDYVVTVTVDNATTEQPVTIVAGEAATPLFNLNAGRLTVRPLASAGAAVDSGAAVFTTFSDGNSATNYGETAMWVPAGDVLIEVTVGSGKATETVVVAAGEEVDREIVVGVGRAVINAFYVEGMRVDDGGLSVNVRSARKDIQGNQEDFGTGYGPDSTFDLPPGDYVAVTQMGEARVEQPFSVVSGELVEVAALLEAGVLVVTAPGTDFVEVFSGTADIQGDRASFGYAYGGALQTTLPAGDYLVRAAVPDGEAREATATVVAGERTELTID